MICGVWTVNKFIFTFLTFLIDVQIWLMRKTLVKWGGIIILSGSSGSRFERTC